MVNEYTSRFYRDKENFSVKAYHSSRNLIDMCDIFSDGYLDPKAEHRGECPYDVIWFTISDDYDHGFRFSFQIDQDTFNEFGFRWMNDNHLATPSRIDVMDKRLRVETINGKSLDKVYERFYDGTQNGFNEFIDRVFELSDYQLSNELFVMKILQQYGFRRSDYFMDDESQGLNEDMMEDKKKNNQYVRQDIMLDVTAGDCGVMEGQLTEVEANDVNLKSFEIQDELNPKFWINNKINSRVRLKLLDLADEFFDSLNIKWVKPKDIVLTGSIANYNWSKYSDVDVHILVDYKEVWEKTDFVKDYFDSKKQIWGEEHDGLKIYGFPVEIYVEDANVKNPNSGIYSLEKNEWVVEPNDFQDAEINEERIKEISARLMTEIDDIDDKLKTEKDNHKLETLSTKMKKLFDKLVKQRKESLKKHGEMGTYNIIWKVLRRAGYLDKIWDIINNIYNKVNSIKESATRHKPKIEEAMGNGFSFEYLSSLDTEEALKYCTEQLGENVGIGSSRAVFQIDDAQVLKLALNQKGIAQNRVEASTKQMKSPLFPYILYTDNNNKWLVTEYVLPAQQDDFEHCLGMDKYDFFYDIIPDIKNLKYRGGMSAYEDEFAYYHGDSEFYRLLAKYILDYDIPIGDIVRIENWGITKRNGQETLVILDPGWNKETMRLYGGWPSES